MKVKSILLAITTLLLFSCSSSIEESEVPKSVMESFTDNYSDTMEVSWRKEGDAFMAEFTQEDKKISVTLNDEGEWVKGKTSDEQDDEDVETILHTLPIN